MKKIIAVIISIAVIAMCFIALSACEDADNNGLSAYELAVKNGFEGTETEWLESLKGTDGEDGVDGTNGINGLNGTDGKDNTLTVNDYYDAAVEAGYEGAMLDFIKEVLGDATVVSDNKYTIAENLLSSVSIVCQFEIAYDNIFYGSGTTTTSSSGSGVIYKLDKSTGSAYIITNYHVVYAAESVSADKISRNINVYLYGGETGEQAIPATFIGGAMNYDVAVLYIENSDILKNSDAKAVEFADSNEIAVGQTAIAIGNGTSADGNNSLAIGYSAHANKTNGIAIGNTAKANGEYGIAIGYKAEANGDSIAIGWDTTAGNSSIAIGNGAKATERISTAVGYGSIASGEGAAALGGDAVGNYSVALGTQAKANGVYSFAGADADADGEYSISIGYQTKVSAEGGQSTAIGYRASATEKWSTAFGYYAKASGEQSIAVGYAEASAAGSAALGAYAKANGERSTALGRSAVADGKSSVALGDNAKAQAENSVAIGTNSSATEVNTVSFGGTYRYRDEETLTWHDATVYRRLVNVDKGLVAADSHEAINGSQLYDLGDSIRNAFGGNFNFENGALTGDFTYGDETTIQGAFNSIRDELDKLSEGWTFNPVDNAQQSGGDGGAGTGEGATPPASSTIKPGDSLTVNAGSERGQQYRNHGLG